MGRVTEASLGTPAVSAHRLFDRQSGREMHKVADAPSRNSDASETSRWNAASTITLDPAFNNTLTAS
jgi:hypothetical protein